MTPSTPYSKYLGDREPVAAMRDTASRIEQLTAGWAPDRFERTYAPGKWTARQILIHLAQSELALGTRARMALSTPNYVAQPFDQDAWIARESSTSAADALAAFLAATRLDVALFASLSAADRQISLAHPEYGALTVDWIVHTIAGHQINHLQQMESIGKG